MKKNETPLHYAAKHNSKAIGEMLISKGANVNSINNNSQNIKFLF